VDFRSKPTRAFLVVASVALYGASLVLPAFTINHDIERGWWVLLSGWLTFLEIGVTPLAFPAWLANLCIPLTWVVCLADRRRPALITATVGLVFAVVLPLYPKLAVSEAGGVSAISAWGPGYFAWVGSFVIALLCASLTTSINQRREPPENIDETGRARPPRQDS
jgi:hypothetical protein